MDTATPETVFERQWADTLLQNTMETGRTYLGLPIAATSENQKWLHQPSDRHGGGANLSFADGHLEFKKWRWPKALAGPGSAANQPDLQDLRWLQAGLPEP